MAKEWYIIYARSGYEFKVKLAIEESIERDNLAEYFDEILIPTESVIELKNGKKKNTERKFFPGYMFIKMELTQETWLLIKNISNVSGFIGGKNSEPTPVNKHEMDKIINKIQEGVDKPKPKVLYKPGEEVLIIDGPFNEFSATVESANYEKNTMQVSVLIFGRITPVVLGFFQVEKT